MGLLIAVSLIVWEYRVTLWGWLNGTGDAQESGSATIRNLGLVVAGVVALIFAGWRTQVASKQAEVARQSLLNDRYQKAAEMLGDENLSVRLGGVYALQALIEEHPEQYYVSCMRLLCAFVRNPPVDEYLTPLPDKKITRSGGGIRLRADVQAVMDMMRSRDNRLIALEERNRSSPKARGLPIMNRYRQR